MSVVITVRIRCEGHGQQHHPQSNAECQALKVYKLSFFTLLSDSSLHHTKISAVYLPKKKAHCIGRTHSRCCALQNHVLKVGFQSEGVAISS
jgi:hypothetical protein